ncbi:hypothetical protein ACM26V_16815 [Salipaludibacillus sp. HK11]|uniref:hypothetical protein n=1 Tax=Salipaludibacillus sp. HK11 TaxID=3394320 RepID=UPI0039FB9F0A
MTQIQRSMLSIVHLYAKEYGWTREYVLDEVFFDEHILQEKIILESQKDEWLMQSTIALLPQYEEKDRIAFIAQLSDREKDITPIKKDVTLEETKEAIKRAKQQLASM